MRIREWWLAAALATVLVVLDYVPESIPLYVALTLVAAAAGGLVIGRKFAIYVTVTTLFLVSTLTLAAVLIFFRSDPHSQTHAWRWVLFVFVLPIAGGATSALGVWCRRCLATSAISNRATAQGTFLNTGPRAVTPL